jgi:hypothetical protein
MKEVKTETKNARVANESVINEINEQNKLKMSKIEDVSELKNILSAAIYSNSVKIQVKSKKIDNTKSKIKNYNTHITCINYTHSSNSMIGERNCA